MEKIKLNLKDSAYEMKYLDLAAMNKSLFKDINENK